MTPSTTVDFVGVDVGGTFTDLIGVEKATGAVTILKVPSTPENQTRGVVSGVQQMCGPSQGIQRLVHGSTVATNAVLEASGAQVALVTTRGFRDALEIGRCRRMSGNIFDIRYSRPKPLVARRLRLEVTERIRHTGEIETPLDEAELERLAGVIRAEKVASVAVCFLHSYKNPAHEERAKQILSGLLPGVAICTSSEILPEYLEYERFSTTVLNAYIAPVMKLYIGGLAKDLKRIGLRSDVYTMSSSGGVMSTDTTIQFPVRTILSGVAGGVCGAMFVGKAAGVSNMITYDMGGTSTDVCLLKDLNPVLANQSIIAGQVVKTPQIEVHTVGAGGGSIAWVDPDGALKVGPRSAGAVPGPACYGKGGTEVTITDANLILGRLSGGSVLAGQIQLRPELSQQAMATLGTKLKTGDREWLADGVVRLAVTKMASAIRKISIERGFDPRDFTLVAMGGAGPMHAVQVAQTVGIREVIVPPWPGNISALGLLTSDLRHDLVRTHLVSLSQADAAEIEAILEQLSSEGRSLLEKDGLRNEDITIDCLADLRILGQAYELSVPVASPVNFTELVASFHERYKQRYGNSQDDEEVELVNLRVVSTGHTAKPSFVVNQSTAHEPGEESARPVYFDGQWHETRIVHRDSLHAGTRHDGPMIIEEFGSTTIVPPKWRVEKDPIGTLFIRPFDYSAKTK